MIDEKKLIEDIEKEFDGVCVYDVSPSQAVNDFVEIVDRQPKAGQWIPCSERLPVPNEYDETGEFFKAYLVQTKSNRMHTALWDGTYWTIWTRGIVIDKVVAWMPLPEAYKEENNG